VTGRRVSAVPEADAGDHGHMPPLLDRTRGRLAAGQAGEDPRRLATAAPLAALWAAAGGLGVCVCVALVGWFAGSAGTATDAARAGVQAWLLGVGGGLKVGSVSVTALPLGLTLLSGLLLWRAAARAAATTGTADVRAVASGAAMVTGVFATVAMAAALFTATDASAVSPVRAFLGALLLAVVFSLPGMLRGAGLSASVWQSLPGDGRAALRGAAAAVLTMLAAGSLLVTAALVADFGEAANLAHATAAGVVGGAILTTVGVLLLPNAAVLAVAYLLGPGFAFGTGTVVAPSGVVLGRVPAFPLLAALPDQGTAPVWAAGLLAVPVLAAVLGAAVALRYAPAPGLNRAALRGGLAGLAAGAALGLLTGLGGGAVGPGRMSGVGADVLACSASATVAMTLAGVVGGLLLGWRARRRTG
jgi:hypothetical protein